MPLELKQPPPDDAQVGLAPELTLGAIDGFQARIDAYIDAFVAEQKRQLPNQPVEVLRRLLLRGECACKAAKRLLEQQ
jgi:hypothetical protein